ncbi:MAG TPA: DUF1003 domain-containing protein [Candidatus Nanoarchaeia archaeon]|nr:DUF1003 domain-containing protein [Candidatus Nanoarchaeia archaeon]
MTRKHKKHDLDIEKLDVVDVLKMEIHKVEETLRKVDEFYRKDLRRMDRLSDKIAQVGGSWSFILGFFLFLGTWVVLNAVILTTGAFDPYPFILLNLFMSALASIQAPIILMSTNRASRRDQARLEIDLEKDLRDLHVDQSSHEILLELHRDINQIKKKLQLK